MLNVTVAMETNGLSVLWIKRPSMARNCIQSTVTISLFWIPEIVPNAIYNQVIDDSFEIIGDLLGFLK